MKRREKRKTKSWWAAEIISRLFDPTWLVPILLAGAVVWSLVNGLRWRFLVLLILIDGFVPFLYFWHLLSTKEISDWETSKRTERFRFYWFTIAVHAIGILLALLLGKIPLAKILFSFWILAFVYGSITLRWKISIHTGVASAAVAFIVFLFGVEWLWLFGIVGLIGWSRMVLKEHTLAQITLGALLSPLLLWTLFALVGLTRGDAIAPSQAHVIGWFR